VTGKSGICGYLSKERHRPQLHFVAAGAVAKEMYMPVTWTEADEPGWQVLNVTGQNPADLSVARRWTETRLGGLDEAHRVDTLLVTGELLDNAYHHAGGPVQLRLHRLREPCEVTVAVADHGREAPRPRVPSHDGGRGLLLVDRICLDWGVSHHDDGKLVWGRVTCADSGSTCGEPGGEPAGGNGSGQNG
jgi:anti-sigma regulatory factor (Ser/Thr protein kinase)